MVLFNHQLIQNYHKTNYDNKSKLKFLYPNKTDNQILIEKLIDNKFSLKFEPSYSTIVHFHDLSLINSKENLLHLAKINLKHDQPTKIMYHSLINLKSNLKIIHDDDSNLELIHSDVKHETIDQLNERLNHFISLYPSILSDLNNESKHIFTIKVKPITKLTDCLPSKYKHFIRIRPSLRKIS